MHRHVGETNLARRTRQLAVTVAVAVAVTVTATRQGGAAAWLRNTMSIFIVIITPNSHIKTRQILLHGRIKRVGQVQCHGTGQCTIIIIVVVVVTLQSLLLGLFGRRGSARGGRTVQQFAARWREAPPRQQSNRCDLHRCCRPRFCCCVAAMNE